MNLRRNFLTIIYAALFALVMGLGLFQILNVTITTASSKYLIAGVVVLGLIIYLILAYLLKEGDYLRAVEINNPLFVIVECIVVAGGTGSLFLLRSIDGTGIAALHSLLLLCLYLTGRLLFGRICGILSAAIGLAVLLSMETVLPLGGDDAVSILSFLIPYLFFMAVNRIVIKISGKNGFLIVMGYLVLGFIFCIAIAMNPLTSFLFSGCVLSLLFARPREEHCKLAKGYVCAFFLVLFTVAMFAAAYFTIPELLRLPAFTMDASVPLSGSPMNFISFIAGKFEKPVSYLPLGFSNGIIPTVIVFFAVLPGYYCITKKSSYIGPLLLGFLGTFAYYILFCENGVVFHYLTYLIPVFAAYGVANTLIADKENADQESALPEGILSEETLQEETLQEETLQEGTLQEETLQEGTSTDDVWEDVQMPDTTDSTSEPAASGNGGDILPDSRETRGKSSVPEKEEGHVKISLLSRKDNDEIPEWTMPEDFTEGSEEQPEDRETETPETETPEFELPEENSITLPEPDTAEQSAVETLQPDMEWQADTVEPQPDIEWQLDSDQLSDAGLSPDIEQQPEDVSDIDAANVISTSDELTITPRLDQEEPELVSLLEETDTTLQPEDLIGLESVSDDMATLSEYNGEDPDEPLSDELLPDEPLSDELLPDEPLSDEPLSDEDPEDKTGALSDDDDKQQLDELLERLDISDHIKRMNESARVDMADVIEREEEQEELNEALPLKPSKSTLPKYKKPNFDIDIPPISIPLDDSYSNISEYDEVPTIHELESRWRAEESGVVEIDADTADQPKEEKKAEEPNIVADKTKAEPIHSEEIVKKSGMGKRSYHRITIR